MLPHDIPQGVRPRAVPPNADPAARARQGQAQGQAARERLGPLVEGATAAAAELLAELVGEESLAGDGLAHEQPSRAMSETARQRAILRAILRWRGERRRLFGDEMFAEPCWEILLELARARFADTSQSIKSLCLVAGIPETTAARRIDDLVRAGLIVRKSDPGDRRRVLVTISDQGAQRVADYLDRISRG